MRGGFRLEIADTSCVSVFFFLSEVQTQPPVVTGKGNTHSVLHGSHNTLEKKE